RASPITYAAYGVTSEMTVSTKGSSTRRRTNRAAAATAAPSPAPPPASFTNSRVMCPADIAPPATATEIATLNSSSEVASLNSDSACTSVCMRGGRKRRRASAVTATGSVEARIAPSTKASAGRRGVIAAATSDRESRYQYQPDREDRHRPPYRAQVP